MESQNLWEKSASILAWEIAWTNEPGGLKSDTTEQLTLSLLQDCVRLHPFSRSKQRGGGLRCYLFTEKCVRRFLKGKGRLGPSLPWVVKRTNEVWKALIALPSPTATRPELWLLSPPPFFRRSLYPASLFLLHLLLITVGGSWAFNQCAFLEPAVAVVTRAGAGAAGAARLAHCSRGSRRRAR